MIRNQDLVEAEALAPVSEKLAAIKALQQDVDRESDEIYGMVEALDRKVKANMRTAEQDGILVTGPPPQVKEMIRFDNKRVSEQLQRNVSYWEDLYQKKKDETSMI